MENKYWWECESCHAQASFPDTVGAEIAAFIWDTLSKNWDQDLLLRQCTRCNERRLRIAFNFGSAHPYVFRVNHIVGIFADKEYVPLLKEFYEVSKPDQPKYDLTYLRGRNPAGLKKPAIVSGEEMKELFKLFCEKTKRASLLTPTDDLEHRPTKERRMTTDEAQGHTEANGGFTLNIESKLEDIEKELTSIKQSLGAQGPGTDLGALMSLGQQVADLENRLARVALVEAALFQSLKELVPGLAQRASQFYSQSKRNELARAKAAIEALDSMLDKNLA